jgi:CheY-like chemotaxis protein
MKNPGEYWRRGIRSRWKEEKMTPKKVLLIDDESLIRKTTSLLLQHENIETITAEGGKTGIEMALAEHPDLILLDITMPVMNGWEVLARLKSDENLKHIPVIVFTAHDVSVSDTAAKERGAAGVCRKPFYPRQLLSLVNKMAGDENHSPAAPKPPSS